MIRQPRKLQDLISGVDWARREVMADLTHEAIRTAPAYDRSKAISLDVQLASYEHYGMKFYED